MRTLTLSLAVIFILVVIGVGRLSELQLNVASPGVGSYPGDRCVVTTKGGGYIAVFRVSPGGEVNLIAQGEREARCASVTPITHLAGRLTFVALQFDNEQQFRSLDLPRLIGSMRKHAPAEIWSRTFGASSVRALSLDIGKDLRPIASVDQLQDMWNIAKTSAARHDDETLASISKQLFTAKLNLASAEHAIVAALIHAAAGRPERAKLSLDNVINNSPEEEIQVCVLSGILGLATDQFEFAEARLRTAVSKLKHSAREPTDLLGVCYESLALLKIIRGEPEEALELVQPYLADSDRVSLNCCAVALAALVELGRCEEAATKAAVVVERSPAIDSVRFSRIASTLLLNHGRQADAMSLERKIAVPANVPAGVIRLATGIIGSVGTDRDGGVKFFAASNRVNVASDLIDRGNLHEAERSLKKSLEYYQSIGYEGVGYGDILYLSAKAAYLGRDFKKALPLVNSSIALEETCSFATAARLAETHFLCAAIQGELGSRSAAIISARKALQFIQQANIARRDVICAECNFLLATLVGPRSELYETYLSRAVKVRSPVMHRTGSRLRDEDLKRSLWQFLSLTRMNAGDVYETLAPFTARSSIGDNALKNGPLIDIFFLRRAIGQQILPLTIEPSYVAFVSMGDGVSRVELGASEPIDEAIRAWRQAMSRRENGAAEKQRVRELVWEPLAAVLPKEAKRLYVCAEWELGAMPWEALPFDDSTQLIDHLAIHRIPASRAGRIVARQKRRVAKSAPDDSATNPSATNDARESGASQEPQYRSSVGSAVKRRLLLVGDVDYGRQTAPVQRSAPRGKTATSSPTPIWPPLPATAEELALLRRAAPDEVVELRGQEASKYRVGQELERATVAHFATHGFANANLGERARHPLLDGGESDHFGLAFARANELGGRALLSATEVSRMELPHLELAVLSGCETGIGQPRRRQYFTALNRAFHLAGAKHVLASMWRVDDQATLAIMNRFYREHFQGKKSPAEALRAAQLNARDNWMQEDHAVLTPTRPSPTPPSDSTKIAAVDRGPNFSARAPLRTTGRTIHAPDWAWAGWYVSSIVSEP